MFSQVAVYQLPDLISLREIMPQLEKKKKKRPTVKEDVLLNETGTVMLTARANVAANSKFCKILPLPL